jgi:hypothetical protein
MNWLEIERFASFPPMETVVQYRISQGEARELLDLRQQVANLEEYMLKGIAFRDGLQARIKLEQGNVDTLVESCEALQSRLAASEAKVAEYQEKADAIHKYLLEKKPEALMAVITELSLDSERRRAKEG